MRSARSDYEIALPLYEMQSFAAATGYYTDLPDEVRHDQIAPPADPLRRSSIRRLRIYLFDARRLYSAPVTVFGPLLAVLYIGRNYSPSATPTRIAAFTTHFDQLVREATITARALPDHLMSLRP